MSSKRTADITSEQINQMVSEGYELLSHDLNRARVCAEKANDYATNSNDNIGIAGSLILLGICDNISGVYASAIQRIQQGIDLGKVCRNPNLLAKGFHALGNTFARTGDLESALEAYLQGIEQTRLGNGDYERTLLNNISVVYSKTNRLSQALNILLEAKELEEENTSFYGFLLANIAEVYFKMGELSLAEQSMLAAEKVFAKSPLNIQHHIQLYKIKGKIASYQNQDEGALIAFGQATELCERLGDKFRLCSIGFEIGRHYMSNGQYDLAVESLKRAQLIGEAISSDVELRDIAMSLGQCYENLAQYQEALCETKRYHHLYQKINTKTLESLFLSKTVMFEVEQARKEAEIQRLKNEEVHLIGKIGQIITATLDINMVLSLIYKHIHSIVEVDAFGVCTVNHKDQMIEFKMMIENGKKVPLHRVPMDDPLSIAARCIRERQMIHLQDLDLLDRVQGAKGARMLSVIFFPLVVSDEIIGLLTLQSQRPNAYSEKALRLVESLGAYIGIALKNSMQSAELTKKSADLERLSQTDVLTNLYNRRYMMTRLDQQWAQSQLTKQAFHIAILDVDHFKHVNDQHGHHVGDSVLIEIANLMHRRLRKYDVVGRWGGEEFILLIPESDEALAFTVCEHLRQSFEKKRVMHHQKRIPVTVTIGLTKVTENDERVDDVIQRADRALYEGKNNGRNRLCVL